MTQKAFLYEQLDGARKMRMPLPKVPEYVVGNLNPDFGLREYQKEAFGRFFHCYGGEYEGKEYPLHFLFNMATGSGKTLIMAGLMLYLYKQGYRNFLFFTRLDHIIKKTEDNFLNEQSLKYLFNKRISIDNREVKIVPVENFDDANDRNVNICFTTISKLHGDLKETGEDSLSTEDFKNKKIVLLADEAHNIQVQTRQQMLFDVENWENTIVNKILKKNGKNLLLEFTATMDFLNPSIREKYKNKVLYRYDLKQFRNDGFSKDPRLLPSDTSKEDRIVQAIILNQYRQEVAGKHGINLKPVILFKAQRTIAQSQDNKNLFHKIIGELSVRDIKTIREKTNVEILHSAFEFFKEHGVTDALLVRKLKDSFAENKCLSVNEDKEKEEYQLLLNSLEDKNNKIRAIFAVQKLNEGWDVLNLFDIVRLYDERGDGRENKPGPTTISEAQLIGRGARYFPFKITEEQDKYKRKFDKNLDNELRVLEELHYHSHAEPRYISEIRTALKEAGLIDENEVEIDLKLKEAFKESRFYKSGLVWKNDWAKKDFTKENLIENLGVCRRNIVFPVASGLGEESGAFDEPKNGNGKIKTIKKDIQVADIEPHIIRNAMAKSDFYNFDNLSDSYLFPKLQSVYEFVKSKEYLARLGITLEGTAEDIAEVDNGMKFRAVLALLNEIERDIKANVSEYEGTEFKAAQFNLIFGDKKIKVRKGTAREDGQWDYVADKDWYVFDALHGTSEEKGFVDLMGRMIEDFRREYREVYLVRNEKAIKIYNFKDGRGFEPDYLLFLVNKKGASVTYQLFVEPKGVHLAEHDKWKDDFLKEMSEKFKGRTLEFGKGKYRVRGVPFYNSENENEFKEKLLEVIK